MNTIEGACSLANLNNSLTNLGPSPEYFWINSLPTTLKNVALVSLATAFANKVLPVPGSPYNITPFGGFIPISSYNSGCVKGNSTASFISRICCSNPPTSPYVSVGALSTFITLSKGSASSARIPTIWWELSLKSTLQPSSNCSLSTIERIFTYNSSPPIDTMAFSSLIISSRVPIETGVPLNLSIKFFSSSSFSSSFTFTFLFCMYSFSIKR